MRAAFTITCDDNLSVAPVGAALVPAGADVDASITRLDAGKVQFCSCTHRRGRHYLSIQISTKQFTEHTSSRSVSTLFEPFSTIRDGLSIQSGPVVKVWRRPRNLTAQSNRAALGRFEALWIDFHHQGGCSCKMQRS